MQVAFLHGRQWNWDEISDDDDDDKNWAEFGVPSSHSGNPRHGNHNDDTEREESSQGSENLTEHEMGTSYVKGKCMVKGKGKVRAMEEWKRKGNGKEKGIVSQTPLGEAASFAIALQVQDEMYEADSDLD
jgi:hypothetical protein